MKYSINYETVDSGRFEWPRIELTYPRSEDCAKYIQVGLCDVRAADDIRISYDFDRDGWAVEQSTHGDDVVWQEVGFFKAWALETEAAEHVP